MQDKNIQRQLIKNCFQCQKKVEVKYNNGTGKYVKRNDWYYWTEDEKNEGKYVCNSCLLGFYYQRPKEYQNLVHNKKKRRVLTSYIYDKTIS
jgi:hypothetical protein